MLARRKHIAALLTVLALLIVLLFNLQLSSLASINPDDAVNAPPPSAPSPTLTPEDHLMDQLHDSAVASTNSEFSNFIHLVIVPCHAIFKPFASSDNHDPAQHTNKFIGLNSSDWYLQSFQKIAHDHLTMIKHIEKGVEVVTKDPNALLLFSGGETKKDAGPISEASSYWELAKQRNLLTQIESRTFTEEFARDSYENLLFSIARFYEITHTYPLKITIISYKFKSKRFINLHRLAIHYPETRFNYIGIDPSISSSSSSSSSTIKESDYIKHLNNQENKNAIIPFSKDPYGCTNPNLIKKKLKRNPFRRSPSYILSSKELFDILTICNINDKERKSIIKKLPNSLPWVNLPILENNDLDKKNE